MKFLEPLKKHKIFWGILFLIFIFLLFDFGRAVYTSWDEEQQIKRLAEDLERYEKEREEKMAADTFGGSTPQETLQMFIDAVEAEDYELASKYFVIEKQEKWREDLRTAENIHFLINNLAEALKYQGEFSFNNNKYFLHTPIAIDFTLYPSGNWKIEEI